MKNLAKKITCAVLALTLAAGCAALTGCGKKSAEETTEKAESIAPGLHGAVDTIIKDGGFDESLIGGITYKEDDPEDDYLAIAFGVCDLTANEYLEDYVLSEPTDYNQSIAIFTFSDGMTDEDFDEVKAVVTSNYIEQRASSLKMYMPEEYAIMSWALENPDKIWRQYDNALVLIIDGEGEAKADFEAFEAAAKINGII